MKDEKITYVVRIYSVYLDAWHFVKAFSDKEEAKKFAKGFNDKERCQLIERKTSITETQIKY